MLGRYYRIGEKKDKIIDLNDWHMIKSINKNLFKETLYKSESIKTSLEFDFETSYLLLLEEDDFNHKLESLTEKEAIAWVLDNNLNEVFEEEFMHMIELTEYILLRPVDELEEDSV